MIPLRDVDARARGLPLATTALIAVNALVFVLMLAGPEERFDRRTWRYGAIPRNVTGGEPVTWRVVIFGDSSGEGPTEEVVIYGWEPRSVQQSKLLHVQLRLQMRGVDEMVVLEERDERQPLPAFLTLLTSMFMHGGLAHIAGNMLFLFVFGGRLEHRLGRLRYLLFYLVTGILAGLAHILFNPASDLPTVGASGAVSGLIGGYVLLWPHGRILTLVPIIYLIRIMELPAFFFVLIWVGGQILLTSSPGSVAVWAHLGGFIFGLALIKLLLPAREPPPRRFNVRPRREKQDPFEHFRR